VTLSKRNTVRDLEPAAYWPVRSNNNAHDKGRKDEERTQWKVEDSEEKNRSQGVNKRRITQLKRRRTWKERRELKWKPVRLCLVKWLLVFQEPVLPITATLKPFTEERETYCSRFV